MSKSLNQLLLPGLSISALVIASGIALLNRDYGRDKIESLEAKIERVETAKDNAAELAKAQSTKAKELELKISKIQSAAKSSMSNASSADLTQPAPITEGAYGLGRTAHPEEIKAWDIDVLPDGRGLPKGRGDALTGEEVFAEKCASCHGDFAEGVDNWPVLAGGFDTLADKDPVKTVGSYWPHLSTTWDYVNRSMPFGAAQTLTPDEVYAIVSYILYSNDLVEEDFELSHENFAEFEMYNKDGFVIDDRPKSEYTMWRKQPCMENCKENVEITMRASVVDVTPEEANAASAMGEEHGNTQMAAQTNEEPAGQNTVVALDADLVKAGKKVFKKCAACHQVGDNAKNKTGPHLNDIMGRTFGAVDGFKYSNPFKAAKEEGREWDANNLAEFLAKPKAYIKGTKMSFSGLKKEKDMTAIIEYLKSVSQ